MSTRVRIVYNRKVHVEKSMHIIECADCHVDFGIGDEFMSARRKDHGTFYCPNGHTNYYPQDNAEEKLKKELEATQARLRAEREYATRQHEQRLQAERQRAAAKGQVTKIKNRVKNGMCPCCGRTFQNLARHMQSQHPEFGSGDHE